MINNTLLSRIYLGHKIDLGVRNTEAPPIHPDDSGNPRYPLIGPSPFYARWGQVDGVPADNLGNRPLAADSPVVADVRCHRQRSAGDIQTFQPLTWRTLMSDQLRPAGNVRIMFEKNEVYLTEAQVVALEAQGVGIKRLGPKSAERAKRAAVRAMKHPRKIEQGPKARSRKTLGDWSHFPLPKKAKATAEVKEATRLFPKKRNLRVVRPV